MERVFTGRELVNTSSRLERNAAYVSKVRGMMKSGMGAVLWTMKYMVMSYKLV